MLQDHGTGTAPQTACTPDCPCTNKEDLDDTRGYSKLTNAQHHSADAQQIGTPVLASLITPKSISKACGTQPNEQMVKDKSKCPTPQPFVYAVQRQHCRLCRNCRLGNLHDMIEVTWALFMKLVGQMESFIGSRMVRSQAI